MQMPIRLRHSKLISCFALLLALVACDTYRDNGNWSGTLRVSDSHYPADDRYCETDVEVIRSSDFAELSHLSIQCGNKSIRWSSGAMSRQGMELWQSGRQVGEIFADGTVRIEVREPALLLAYPHRVDKLTVTWTRMGEDLQFTLKEETEWRTRTYEGSLQRRN